MKKKNALMIALSLCLAAVIAVGATLAYFTDSTKTMSNVVTTGNVKIKLYDESESGKAEDGITDLKVGTVTHENEQNPNSPQTGIKYEDVMPGDKLSKRVSVDNLADMQDCYVAIQVDVSSTNTKLPVADIVDQIKDAGEENGWGYYVDPTNANTIVFYLTDTLNTALAAEDGTVDTDTGKLLFTQINIPTTWNNDVVDSSFTIDVKAAAIQEANVPAPAVMLDDEGNPTGTNETLGTLIGLLNPTITGSDSAEGSTAQE